MEGNSTKRAISIYNRIIPLIIAVLIVIVLLITSRLWEGIELKAYDFRLQTIEYLGIGRKHTAGRVVIVGMEENDLDDKPLIFWYPDIGRFIGKMKSYDVQAVGIDIIPAHSLGEKLTHAVKTIIGSEMTGRHNDFLEEVGERADKSLLAPILIASESVRIVQAVGEEIVPYYFSSMAYMKNVIPALAKITTDRDSVLRRQKLGYGGNRDSFAYALYKSLGGKAIEKDTIIFNYSLKGNIPYYSFKEVMTNDVGRDIFYGKCIILGFVSKSGVDTYFTPLGRRLPGVTLHAIAVETLLTQTYLRDIPFAINAGCMLILAISGLIISAKLRPFYALSGIIFAAIAFLLINIAVFSRGILMPIFPHILSLPFMFTFIYPYRYFIEEKSKKRLYRAFSYYVDKKVIDSIIEKDPASLLKGENRNISILSLDIRGFTQISHKERAENIVRLLNVYFAKIVDIIQSHNGFVNKFMGDGLLAFFGSEENPVENAVRASKEIIEETEDMNNTGIVSSIVNGWRLHIGIGIHYGEVIVGNIGSEKKMDFTIIGSPVNIATRVEGLTKTLQKPVLITHDAYRMIEGRINLEYLGGFAVKGIEEPIKIYTFPEEL